MGFSGYSSVHWPPGRAQGIQQMRLDAQQAQFEYLEQSAGACAHDDDFGLDHVSHGNRARRRQARPALESVGVW